MRNNQKSLLRFLISKLFPVLFFWQSSVFSWNISRVSLEQKIQAPIPPWMAHSFQRDFIAFDQGFSSSDIAECLDQLKQMQGTEAAGLVKITISHKNLSYAPLFPLSDEQKKFCKGFLSALRQLDNVLPLPSLQFLITVNRSFDRPILLKDTFVPIFAISKESHNKKVVLIPRLWDPDREKKLNIFSEWDQKKEKGAWRGSTTGGAFGFYDWAEWPRSRLVFLSKHHPELLDAAFIPSSILNDYMTNWIKELDLYSNFISPHELSLNKYLFCLDGKSSSSCLEWQLFSGSVILKTRSNKIEWFSPLLVIGKHYIQYDPNGPDAVEKILWLKANDSEAKKIGDEAHFFAINHLLDEEVFTYLYHLLEFYALLYRAS